MDEDFDEDEDVGLKNKRRKRKMDEEEEEEEEEDEEEEEEEEENSDNEGLFSSDDDDDERKEEDLYDNEDDDDASVQKNNDDVSMTSEGEDDIEDEQTHEKRVAKIVKDAFAATSTTATKKKKAKKKAKTTKTKRQKKSLPQKNFGDLLAKARTLTASNEKDTKIARESLVGSNMEDDAKLALASKNEALAQRAAKVKRMKIEKAKNAKGSSCFPRETIGYNPDIGNVFTERERRHVSQGIIRVAAEAIKHLDIKKTRFVSCNTKETTTDFYSNPCSLCCLWCTEPFANPPFPLPRRVSPIKSGVIAFTRCDAIMLSDQHEVSFHVTGQYCSPSCVLAAADECTRLNNSKSLKPLVFFMFRKVYNIPSLTNIVQAPDRRMLVKYGGIMSIEAFRATGAIGIQTTTIEMPLVPFYAGVEEVEKIKFCVRETLEPGGVVDYVVKVVNSIGAQALTSRNAYQQQPQPREMKRPFDIRNTIKDTTPSSPKLFSAMPTIAQQLALSERMMVLEKEAVGDKTGNVKRKTLKDFMRLESRPRILPSKPMK